MGEEAIFTNFKRINSKDVTEEFVDIQSRLNTKKEVRDKYVELLRNKAKTVEEVLKAEEAIRHLQEEIEAREGRLRYLSNQTSLSTINLNLYQKVEYQKVEKPYEFTFFKKLKKGFVNGWEIVVGFILLMVNFWPLLLLGGFLYYKKSFIFKRFKKEEDY